MKVEMPRYDSQMQNGIKNHPAIIQGYIYVIYSGWRVY